MLSRILPLLNKVLPKNLAFKGLGKIDPRIGKFLAGATAAGYTADAALDFLRNQFHEPMNEEGLRTDELAAETRVRQGKEVPEALSSIGKVGLGIGAATVLPQVIGNLFGENEEEQPPPPPERKQPMSKEETLQQFKQGRRQRLPPKPPGVLSPDVLRNQFENDTRTVQGKEALLQSMKEITEYLKNLKGQ